MNEIPHDLWTLDRFVGGFFGNEGSKNRKIHNSTQNVLKTIYFSSKLNDRFKKRFKTRQ